MGEIVAAFQLYAFFDDILVQNLNVDGRGGDSTRWRAARVDISF